MKKTNKTNPIAALALSTLLICSTHVSALAGGVNDGGGSDIEAGFKTKVLSLADELVEMPESSKKLLKFDAEELSATLNAQGRFKALCANGTILNRLQQEQKMARVYAEASNTVYLNCQDYSLEQWRGLFSSHKTNDSIFFLHESLRVQGKENEDDYGISSSYLAAIKNQQSVIQATAYQLFYPQEGAKCKVFVITGTNVFNKYLGGGSWENMRVYMEVNKNIVFDTGVVDNNYRESSDIIRAKILQDDTRFASIVSSKKLDELAKVHSCGLSEQTMKKYSVRQPEEIQAADPAEVSSDKAN